FAVTNVGKGAVYTSTREAWCTGRGAGRDPRRNQRAEPVGNQSVQRGIRVNRLEVPGYVVADVPGFKDHLAVELMLDAQAPFLRPRLVEPVIDLGVVPSAGIHAKRNVAEVRGLNVRSEEAAGHQARRRASRPRNGARVHNRR